MDAMGVSRTVMREAVAALARRGADRRPARASAPSWRRADAGVVPHRARPDRVAGRCAAHHGTAHRGRDRGRRPGRRTRHAMRNAWPFATALAAIDAAIDRGEAAVDEDFAFHAVITDATGNPQFRRFLDFLGRFIIPRASVRIRTLNLRTYLMTFQQEHRAIVAAIEAQVRWCRRRPRCAPTWSAAASATGRWRRIRRSTWQTRRLDGRDVSTANIIGAWAGRRLTFGEPLAVTCSRKSPESRPHCASRFSGSGHLPLAAMAAWRHFPGLKRVAYDNPERWYSSVLTLFRAKLKAFGEIPDALRRQLSIARPFH